MFVRSAKAVVYKPIQRERALVTMTSTKVKFVNGAESWTVSKQLVYDGGFLPLKKQLNTCLNRPGCIIERVRARQYAR